METSSQHLTVEALTSVAAPERGPWCQWRQRVVSAAVWIANVWMLAVYVCIVLPSSPVFDRSDNTMPKSLLRHPDIATPFIWSYFGFCVLEMPPALYYWCLFFSSASLPAYTSLKCCVRTRLVKWLSLCLIVWPVVTFFVFMFTPASICIRGSIWWAYGGYCICDVRPLREANGVLQYQVVPPNLTIAFVGDTDLHIAEKVYKMIRAEGVDGVVLNGDMDYWGDAGQWDSLYQKHLSQVPFYVTVGNHETYHWRDYQDVTAKRHKELGVNQCRGSIGVRSLCTHKGVGLLLSGAGSGCGGLHDEHTPFFQEALQELDSNDVIWRVCLIHMPEPRMTLGSTTTRIGYDKYELCRKHGAIIINSHSHLYGRTHELAKIDVEECRVSRKVPPGSGADQALLVSNGTTFTVVTGLGGGEMEAAESDSLHDPIWAAVWDVSGQLAHEQQVKGFSQRDATDFGAFFCSFHVDGDPQLARCYFKDIQGRMVDDFYARRPGDAKTNRGKHNEP